MIIEHSTDLVEWQRWSARGNDGIPRNAGSSHSFTAPQTPGGEFFRFILEGR